MQYMSVDKTGSWSIYPNPPNNDVMHMQTGFTNNAKISCTLLNVCPVVLI